MKYKMIAIDLDGTLLNHHSLISEQNKKAIQRAKEMGVQVVLCTGRAVTMMYNYVEELGLHTPNQYIITFNGAITIDAHTKEIMDTFMIGAKQAQDLFNIAEKYNVHAQTYKDGACCILGSKGFNQWFESYLTLCKDGSLPIEQLNCIQDITYSVPKVLFIQKRELLLEMKKEIDLWASKNGAKAFFSADNFLEVINDQTDKGLAVKGLAQKLNISMEEVICIGDGQNDIPMIKLAGLGVAVANARDEVKQMADYVTIKNNGEHAVEEVIHKFIMNQ